MNNTISINNLRFSFKKENEILKDVSLSVAKGEFLSILGASGSGKSTLLRVVSNILDEKSGDLKGDVSIFGKTPKEYLNTGKLSFMFQEANLMPNLNVRENISFPLKLRGTSIDEKQIDELLEVVGLTDDQKKYPSELSGGMKTRVSLARAFVTKPEVLLLDEPFSALDISWRYELYGYLNEVAKKFKTTLLIVTHDIQESILLANQIVILSKGGSIIDRKKPERFNIDKFGYESVNKVLKKNHNLILDLQTKILIDGIRETADFKKVDSYAEYLKHKVSKDKLLSESELEKLQIFKKFIDDEIIYNKLLNTWKKSKQWKLKQELMWRLLDSKWASKDIHHNVYSFIKNDWKAFVTESKQQEYFRMSEIFNNTTERLNNSDYPSTKDWLYLVYLKAMTEGNKEYEIETEKFIESYSSDKKDIPYFEFVNIQNDIGLENEK